MTAPAAPAAMDFAKFLSRKTVTITDTAHLITRKDSNNCTDSIGWYQEQHGTDAGMWTAALATRSKTFKTERGARKWFARHASANAVTALCTSA